MRSGYFLALPVLATAMNLLFASFLLLVLHPRKANAQLQPGNIQDLKLGLRPTEPEPYLTLMEEAKKTGLEDDSCSIAPEEEEEEKDPMLKAMPIDKPPYFVDVYTRADVSTFYQEEPGSRTETKPKFKGQAAKFINISPFRMDLYWMGDNGKPYFIQAIGPWENGGTASFPGHRFYFQRKDTNQIVCRWRMVEGASLYYYDPYVEGGDDEQFVAVQGDYGDNFKKMLVDRLNNRNRESYESHRFNLKFATQYKNFTGGSEWLSHYPRNPPLHKIWRADYFGQEHIVQTYETQFKEIPAEIDGMKGEKFAVKRNNSADIAFPEYREPGIMNITIKAVSAHPRAFQIEHFLSEVEVNHILDVVQGRYELRRSTTGNVGKKERKASDMSDTRTSKNTWVPRTASPILDAIYRRVADALRLDEALLRKRSRSEPQLRHPDTFGDEEWRSLEPINEQMQIVHYGKTEEYTAHHDFGYSEPVSRSINFCIYLNEGMKGGETSFPRWRNAETSEGMNMTPQKGKAMIFYMVSPDGNLDDLTQHAALPVREGEKWFSNLWIWDPYRS